MNDKRKLTLIDEAEEVEVAEFQQKVVEDYKVPIREQLQDLGRYVKLGEPDNDPVVLIASISEIMRLSTDALGLLFDGFPDEERAALAARLVRCWIKNEGLLEAVRELAAKRAA
jgi:hypothetical protein